MSMTAESLVRELRPGSADGSHPRPLMLYVHVPFCNTRCSFCDWVEGIAPRHLLLRPGDSMRVKYFAALCREIRTRGKALERDGVEYVPQVIYWGGGTASSVEEREADAVMQALADTFDLSNVHESTIECSPDSIDRAKLGFFRSLGFNRMSSGVQSFDDERLRRIGRRHTAEDARLVVSNARDAGFDEVSIDIMSGLPGQPDEEVLHTTREALKLPISHLSLYSYRPTDGTHIRKRIDGDHLSSSKEAKSAYLRKQLRQFARSREMVADHGLVEYASGYFGSPSPFATMTFQLSADMMGFGSGAASLMGQRFSVHQKGLLHDYVRDPLHLTMDVSAGNDRTMLQYLQIGLSMFDGVLRDEWERAIGVPLANSLERHRIAPLVGFLRRRGLIEDERGVRLDPRTAYRTLIELAFEMAMLNRHDHDDQQEAEHAH